MAEIKILTNNDFPKTVANKEKALALIAEAKEKNATFLDIGNCGLTELPDELFELTQLEFLNLGAKYLKDGQYVKSQNTGWRNVIKWVPWRIKRLVNLTHLSLHACYCGDITALQNLKGLEYLDMYFNVHVRDLSPLIYMGRLKSLNLCYCRVSEIKFLRRFKKLEFIDLGYNRVKDLSVFKKLPELKVIKIQGMKGRMDASQLNNNNSLVEMCIGSNEIDNLESIKKHAQLKKLNLFDAKVKDLAFVSGFKNLQSLNLWKNQVEDVSPLTSLDRLKELNLRENQLKDVSVLTKLPKLEMLDVSFNPIENSNLAKMFENIKSLNSV